MFLHKLKLTSAVVVLLVVAGGGLGMMAYRPQAAHESPSPPAGASADKPMSAEKHVDLYGDPLPEGAVMRLGTLQRRAVGVRLAVSADGRAIISVRGGKYVRIWDADTGRLRQKYQLPGSASDCVFSADGRLLLTGLSAGVKLLKLWDVQSGKLLHTLALERAGLVWPAAFSAENKLIAVADGVGKDYRVCVWELATGKVVFRKDVREVVAITRIVFTPDGKGLLAAIGANPPYLVCWDLGSGRRLWNVNHFSPYAMVCTPDGKLLSSDKPQVLELATGKIVESEKMPTVESNSILRMLLSPDGRTLFASTFKKVIVWDRLHGKVVRTLPGTGEHIALWPDGKSVLTNNRALQRWDVASGKALYADTFAQGHTGAVGHLVWSADGRRIASDAAGMHLNPDGTLRVWDAVTGWPLHRQDERKTFRSVTANIAKETGDEVVDLSPDGCWLLTNALGEECLKVWKADTGKEIRTLEFPPAEQKEWPRQLFRARFSSDGARVVAMLDCQSTFHTVIQTAPPHNQIVVWDARTGKRLSCRPIGRTKAESIAIAPDGRIVMESSILRDAASGKVIAELEGMNQEDRFNVAFSRDGALVVGESPDFSGKNKEMAVPRDGVRVWETATGKLIAHVKMKPQVERVFFHPNNRYVATNDAEGIRLWDIVTGKLALHREMPERVPISAMQSVFASSPVFGPAGRLATGHPDGTILIWNMPLPPRKSTSLTAKELEALWTDLAGTDAAKAWRAVWRMADAPKDALAFLRGRVKPYPSAPADTMRKLLAGLDSDSFQRREATVKRLKELGLQAEPALRAALQAKPSLEQRRRIEPLLAALAEKPQSLSTEQLRQLRAVIILERIGSPEARRVLEKVAHGPASAHRTRQARAALDCLPPPR